MSALVIDGSMLEGGGQILRNAMALAAIARKSIKVHSIRANRKKPGLAAQHAAGVQLCGRMCGARVEGAVVGSTQVGFEPAHGVRRTTYEGDAVTAGATTLLLQAALPIAVFADTEEGVHRHERITLELRGGTNAEMAPQIDYTIDVLLPFLHRHFGIAAQVDIIKRGYFPRGGGQLKVTIDTLPPSQKVPPLDLTVRGDITRISGKAYVAGRLSPSIAREVRDAAVARLSPALPSTACIEIATVFELEDRVGGRGFGSGILLYAHSSTGCVLAGDSIGKQGKAPSETGQEAADTLLKQIDHGGCVDEYLQDQIIIFMALAKGESVVKTGPLSLHTRTAIYIAETMTTAKFEVEETTDGVLLRCVGAGA